MNAIKHILGATGLAAALLVSACGGGNSGGVVRTSQPPPPPPPQPPPPPPLAPPADPCPVPITGDCVVEGQDSLTFDEYGMSGGRQSDHSLFVHGGQSGGGFVNLKEGEYRFAGGTEIAGTTLVVWDKLVSDVKIWRDVTGMGFAGESELWLLGTVEGNVLNEQRLNLRCWSGIHDCASVPQQRIDGNYTQLPEGQLETVLGRHLEVTGTAMLDGQLILGRGDARYVLPTAPSSVLVLQAGDGIDGTFDSWSTNSLFLEGALRYTANDVFFDATRISLQAAAAAHDMGHPLSLASAANLDRALEGADRFALAPTAPLDDAQRDVLRSAASIMWLQDTAQAVRSLDSLAGHAHADLLATMHRNAAQASAQLDARLVRQAPGLGPVAWTMASRLHPSGHGVVGPTAGVDQWLSPQLLIGGSVTDGRASLHFDRLGGMGWGEAPGAGVHVHYRGDGWHATGVLGAGRARLWLERPIELGDAGQHLALSQRSLAHGFLHGELGRDLQLGGGTLVPFVALDYSSARGDAFAEHGDTGFELVAGRSRQTRLSGAVGARFARDWSIGRQLLRLEVDARYRRDLMDSDTMRAAFRGVPDVLFDVPLWRELDAGELHMGLSGAIDARSRWYVDYAAAFGRERSDGGWMFGLQRAF